MIKLTKINKSGIFNKILYNQIEINSQQKNIQKEPGKSTNQYI